MVRDRGGQPLLFCLFLLCGSMIWGSEPKVVAPGASFFVFNQFGQVLRRFEVRSNDDRDSAVLTDIEPFGSKTLTIPHPEKKYFVNVMTEDDSTYAAQLACSYADLCSSAKIGQLVVHYDHDDEKLVMSHADKMGSSQDVEWHPDVPLMRQGFCFCNKDEAAQKLITLPDPPTDHVFYSMDIPLSSVVLNGIAAVPMKGVNGQKNKGYVWILRNKKRCGPHDLTCVTRGKIISYCWKIPVLVPYAELMLVNERTRVPKLTQLAENGPCTRNYGYPTVNLSNAVAYDQDHEITVNEADYLYGHCFFSGEYANILKLWPTFYRFYYAAANPLLDHILGNPKSWFALWSYINTHDCSLDTHAQFIILKGLNIYVNKSLQNLYELALSKANEHKNSSLLLLLREALSLFAKLLARNYKEASAPAYAAVESIYETGTFVESVRNECGRIIEELDRRNWLSLDKAGRLLALAKKYDDTSLISLLNKYNLSGLF